MDIKGGTVQSLVDKKTVFMEQCSRDLPCQINRLFAYLSFVKFQGCGNPGFNVTEPPHRGTPNLCL